MENFIVKIREKDQLQKNLEGWKAARFAPNRFLRPPF